MAIRPHNTHSSAWANETTPQYCAWAKGGGTPDEHHGRPDPFVW